LPEFLSQLTAFSVFLAIAAFGFLFLLISLVFGEIFEHLGFEHDHDIGHDAGHDMGHGGPSVLSPRILSVFITAFGGFGAVGTHYGLAVLPASGIGFGSGVFFAAVIYYFARFLYGQQVTTQVQPKDLVGLMARVVVPIPAGGLGQVRCQVGEEMMDKVAKSRDGSPIPANATVTVEQVLGEVLIVKPQ
jgi:membrane protein implicated in regulation of membrane protease activity